MSQASDDPSDIKLWWSRWPEANVGIATGGGLLVIDLDGEEGARSFRAAQRKLGKLPPTVQATTGRGHHFYFAVNTRTELGCSNGKLGRGIDTRGKGGLVVAPPSRHRGGHRYSWMYSPMEFEIAKLPKAWVKALKGKARRVNSRGGRHPSEGILVASPLSPRTNALLPAYLRGLIQGGFDADTVDRASNRSSAEMAVVLGLLRAGATPGEVAGVFEGPMGERWQEHGGDSAYLERLINKGRQFSAELAPELSKTLVQYADLQQMPYGNGQRLYLALWVTRGPESGSLVRSAVTVSGVGSHARDEDPRAQDRFSALFAAAGLSVPSTRHELKNACVALLGRELVVKLSRGDRCNPVVSFHHPRAARRRA